MTLALALLPAAALCTPITIGNITTGSSVPGGRVGVIFGGTNPVPEAVGFTVGQDVYVSSVSVAIGDADTPGSGYTLGIYSNRNLGTNYDIPSSLLDTVGSDTPTGSHTSVTTFYVSGLHLQAGDMYWLVAFPSTDTTRLYWALTGTGPFPIADYVPTNYFHWIPDTIYGRSPNDPYFSIQGDTVPEPASLLLFATGLLALAFFARRHSREV